MREPRSTYHELADVDDYTKILTRSPMPFCRRDTAIQNCFSNTVIPSRSPFEALRRPATVSVLPSAESVYRRHACENSVLIGLAPSVYIAANFLPSSSQRDIELFLMHCGIALDRDQAAQIGLDLPEHVAFGAAQGLGHIGVDAEDDLVVMVDVFRDAARLGQDFIADRLRAFDHAASAAIRAGRAERAFERLFDAFARDGHQAEVVELENLRRRSVAAQFLFERLHDFLAVLALFHVDEVEHDDAA